MSDLISRSELLTRIRLNYNNHQDISASAIKDMIDTMPTAYNPDKVVEELEKLQTYNMSCVTLMSDLQRNGVCRHYICLEDATKIVKQGCVSDDVCEWK